MRVKDRCKIKNVPEIFNVGGARSPKAFLRVNYGTLIWEILVG